MACIFTYRGKTYSEEDFRRLLKSRPEEFALHSGKRYGTIPDAPFKDTWPNLTFRHALFDAINRGQNYIAWPTGEQQADRYYTRDNPGYAANLKAMQAFYDKRMVDYANKLGKAYGAKVEKIDIPTPGSNPIQWRENSRGVLSVTGPNGVLSQYNTNVPSDMTAMAADWGDDFVTHYIDTPAMSGVYGGPKNHTVHALKITPQMRELVGTGGLPLFQRGKSPQGNITVTPDKAIIRLFKTASASTFPHESAHLWLEEMRRYAPLNKAIAQDLQTVMDWLGVQSPDMISRAHHEQFARGFEQYLRTGKAPNKSLKDIFKQFAEWLKSIYRRAADLKVEVPPQIAKVYDRLLAQDQSLAQTERESGLLRGDTSQTFAQSSPQEDESSPFNVFNKAAKATKAFFNPFSEVPNEAAYDDIRNLMIGGIGAAEQSASAAKKLFDKLSQPQKEVVNTYFETKGASPMMVPENIRAETVALKQRINGPLRRALIEKNLLPETALHTHDDSYLPRLYLKHLLDNGGLSGGARLNLSQSKKRKDQSPEALIAMGEIKDPGVRAFYALFRTQRDLAVMDFLNKVSENQDWALKESLVSYPGYKHKVTPYWLKKEADAIREQRIPAEPDADRKAQMEIIAQQMSKAATEGIIAQDKLDYDQKEYRRLPDTPEYGPLRGMVVRRQIARDIMGTNNFVDPDNTIEKLFGDKNSLLTKGTSIWKTLKVPLNPPSQFRNIISNMVLLNLSGVPIHMVGPRMYQAAQDMRKNGPYYQIAKKYGVGKGTFSEQELFAINDELRKLDTKELSGFAGWRAVYRAMLRTADMGVKIHGKMEEWGKVAKIIDEMKRGAKENDAVRAANDALFDYSKVHPSIRSLRQMPLGMPFITFQAKVIPLMYDVIKNHPTRLLPYIALAYTIPAIVAASNEIDEDDADKLRKSLSNNLRRKGDMYLLPWKDDAGRWQFIDIGYFLPWQMPLDVLRHSASASYEAAAGSGRKAIGDAGEALKATNIMSNPVLNVASALKTGIDPFTDRPIADKRDPAQKQVADVVAYALSLVLPTFLSPQGVTGKLYNKESGTGLNRYGEPTETYGQIGARMAGINTYPVIPEAQRARNLQSMQRELQDIKARMTSSLKDQSLTPEQRRRITERFREELIDRSQEIAKYARESQPSEKLRAASSRT